MCYAAVKQRCLCQLTNPALHASMATHMEACAAETLQRSDNQVCTPVPKAHEIVDPINSKQANSCRQKQAHCKNSTVLCAGEFTRGAANAVQTILRTEGVRGLFAGYGSFMLRDLPFDAIEFVAYEQLKKSWVKYKGSDIRPHESAIIGEWCILR